MRIVDRFKKQKHLFQFALTMHVLLLYKYGFVREMSSNLMKYVWNWSNQSITKKAELKKELAIKTYPDINDFEERKKIHRLQCEREVTWQGAYGKRGERGDATSALSKIRNPF